MDMIKDKFNYYNFWEMESLKNELETIRKQILVSKARLSLLEELENIIIRALKLKE